jgi:alpha-beta hydrolase superfamily lysophospholipase
MPAVASALVVAPAGGSGGPRDVIAWAHGTTGIDETCAPSVAEDPFGSGAFFALDRVLDEGWALVATDYVGLGTEGPHPYLIGEGQARSVLDAVRAARQIDAVSLSDRTVVWGHSQGGNAALWTGIRATDYAPDVGVIGVAALAPASDLVALAGGLETLPGGSIFATYMLDAYADTYDDVRVEDYVQAGARVTFDELARRCLAEPAVFASVLTSLSLGWSSFTAELSEGALGERLVENTPTAPIDAPLLLGQGEADPLVLPDVQAAYARARCDAGQPVDYRTYPDRDHVGVVAADSPLVPELIAWTRDRLDGVAPTDTCPT